ncbi:hypothetical protein G7076_00270 [Sphingomonas sp. HDW15A]|uniref:hypothetical protein n=1 Tax=Sphingomonas sp. HDW15A TaxID=2714942 RepID=UPI00140891E0|nr:hypothetical protein [Sphingomonas sp. HDW15A]QIK95128.1 hypothetical protein G7076_00270 [Sphingomonas sp. HDW15A]
MRITTCLIVAALAAGCGSEPEAPPAPPKEIMVRSESQKQLFELNELNRAIALKRAIRDFGPKCLRVTKAGYVGRYKNMDYWTATCEDEHNRTRDWALFIGANDSVQVRLCEDVAKVGLPACVVPEGKIAPGEPANSTG